MGLEGAEFCVLFLKDVRWLFTQRTPYIVNVCSDTYKLVKLTYAQRYTNIVSSEIAEML